MTSGNPAKAGLNQKVAEVRKAVVAGKQATVALTPETKVTIATSNPDEAEFMVRLIAANRNPSEDFYQFLNLTGLYTYLFMGDPKMRKRLLREYKTWIKDMENLGTGPA